MAELPDGLPAGPPPDLSPKASWAVGMTLLDLAEARSTLWGRLVRHDMYTGAPLVKPRVEFATHWVLRRPGLPDGWALWCYARGLLRLVSGSVAPYWLPTPEALDVARKWIADAGPTAGLPPVPGDEKGEQ